MTLPTYKIDNFEYSYEPTAVLTSLCWYNIASCARERMKAAHMKYSEQEPDAGFKEWKRERITFWSTLRRSIPADFK